jgi:hypothetical protein
MAPLPSFRASAFDLPQHGFLVLGSSGVVPWLTALFGAVVGFGSREVYAWSNERRHFKALLWELLTELREIETQARRRATASTPVAGALEPPLPVEAWRLAVSSGKLGTLPHDQLRGLRALYSEVRTANFVAEHWAAFIQISRLSKDEHVTAAFDKEAARVIQAPCEPIAEHVGAVIASVEDVAAQTARPRRRTSPSS